MKDIPPLYDKQLTCPCCNRIFQTKKVRISHLKTLKIDEDFCTYFQNEKADPTYYYVFVCYHCGFSYTESFTPKLTPKQKEKVQLHITLQWTQKNYGTERTIAIAIQTHKLALYTATIIQERDIILAGLCHRLSWLYRKSGDIQMEQHFLNYALKAYIDAYMKNNFIGTKMSEIKLLYIIGELSRRVGNYPQAITYFNKVTNHSSRFTDSNTVERARQQWYLTREQAGEKEDS